MTGGVTHLLFGKAGVALSTNADPNTTPPHRDEQRVIAPRWPERLTSFFLVTGGTTLDVQLWLYEPLLGRWYQLGTATTATPAAMATGPVVPPCSTLFVQVVSNVGVERVGLGFFHG